MKSAIAFSSVRRSLLAVCSATLWLVAATFTPGCGSGNIEFSPETNQTPAALAEEFVFRYKSLPAQASGTAKARSSAIEKAKAKFAATDTDEKAKASAEKIATKKAQSETIDSILDDIEAKFGMVSGMPRSDVAKRVLEILKTDASINDADRPVITERLGKLASGS